MKLKYSIDKVHPTRDLTSSEKVFLQGLAEYTLFFDKSLFFQVCNLLQHTELVLSGETETAYRYEFTDPDELNKEIEELEEMIRELEDKLDRGEISYWDRQSARVLLDILKTQLEKLRNNLGNAQSIPLMGKYCHNHGYDSKVILYLNNIAAYTGDSYKTMLLMGQVLLHEYFHSFYYHAGGGSRMAIKCVEEPMAEFGSLVVLDNVISKEAIDAYYYALDFIREKQNCVGITAAYGFGVYLFKKYKTDFRNLIARYANVSRLFDEHASEVKAYKYLLYPIYPSFESIEDKTYERLEDLLKSGEAKVNLL